MLMDPWPEYSELTGLFEQFAHEPALVPLQLLRYLPSPQFEAQ